MTFTTQIKERIAHYEAKVADIDLEIDKFKAKRTLCTGMITELRSLLESDSELSSEEFVQQGSFVMQTGIRNNSLRSLVSEYLPAYPFDSSREQQILWIIESVFGRAAKRSAVESFYFSCVGSGAKPIKFIFRGMVLRGDLIGNKYNSNNKLTYYGLPDWVDQHECFQPEYLPDGYGIEFKVDTIDVVSYSDEEESSNDVFNTLGME